MGFRPDLRKILRRHANAIQDENAERLLSGQTVRGGEIVPNAVGTAAKSSSSRRRIRIEGIRVPLKQLANRPGVASGAMLSDLTKRGNIKLGRTSFKITPSADQVLKWRVFNAGDRHQPPRPVSGISAERIDAVTADAAREVREQIIVHLTRDLRR